MKIKENRTASYIIIALVYAVAIAVGIVVFLSLELLPWLTLLIADLVATCITFIFSVMLKNASVYDPYWSVQPIVITLSMLPFFELSVAKLLPIIVILIWGIRLTLNWAYTFKNLTHQDWRYSMLKEKTGAFYPLINLLGIHIFPTLVVYSATLPCVYLIQLGGEVNAFAVISLAISLFAVILQATADFQMHKFKKSGTRGFIRAGLWKYSRHPNYLGEILMWWGIALYAVFAIGFKWYFIFGAVLNTLMFFVVSIPLADSRQSKKEGFSEYKKHTRMLLPLYRK